MPLSYCVLKVSIVSSYRPGQTRCQSFQAVSRLLTWLGGFVLGETAGVFSLVQFCNTSPQCSVTIKLLHSTSFIYRQTLAVECMSNPVLMTTIVYSHSQRIFSEKLVVPQTLANKTNSFVLQLAQINLGVCTKRHLKHNYRNKFYFVSKIVRAVHVVL